MAYHLTRSRAQWPSDTRGGVPRRVWKLDFFLAGGHWDNEFYFSSGVVFVWILCSDIYTAVVECTILALRQSVATFIVRFLQEYFTIFLMLVRAFALIYGHWTLPSHCIIFVFFDLRGTNDIGSGGPKRRGTNEIARGLMICAQCWDNYVWPLASVVYSFGRDEHTEQLNLNVTVRLEQTLQKVADQLSVLWRCWLAAGRASGL